MIKDTLYAKYIKQRENAEVLETDKGFVVYKFIEDEIFIKEIFIDESNRQSGVCRELVTKLEDIARINNKKIITGKIFLNDPNCNQTLIAALLIGFKVIRADQDIILILKEIKE